MRASEIRLITCEHVHFLELNHPPGRDQYERIHQTSGIGPNFEQQKG